MPELPEAAEWWDQVSAWGTLGAVIVALFVAINEGRRRRLDKEDADAGQARLVTVRRVSLGVQITNHSLQPLLDLNVTDVRIKEDGGQEFIPTGIQYSGSRDVVAPSQGVRLTLSHFRPVEAEGVESSKQILPSDYVCCTYQFTDAQGLRWQRHDLQQPERLRGERRSRLGRLAFWRR